MKGQISIDYLAGALVFFGSIVLLVSNVMTVAPEFTASQKTDELQLEAWTISEVIMEDRGYWEKNTQSGEAWHENMDGLEIIGLKGERGLSREKVQALLDMEAEEIREVLRTDKKFNVDLREVIEIDTSQSFDRTDPSTIPDFITGPSYGPDTSSEVHYGTETLSGEEKYFLLMKDRDLGWYNNLSVSSSWDFSDSDTEFYNLSSDSYIPAGGGTYIAGAGNTEISEGRLLILERDIGSTGDFPRESVEEVVSAERYGVMDGNVVEVSFRLWN